MDNSQTGVIAEAAVQPDQNVMQTGTQGVQEPQMVPVTALQAERRERQQLQENLKLLQDHVSLLQAQQHPKQAEADPLSSLSDNDVLTVGEAKKFIQNFSREQKLAVEELKISQANPDYNEVVKKYLPDVLKNDPELKDVIMNAPNPYKAAYHLAKRSDAYLQDQRVSQRSPEAQKAVQNLARPGNLSAVGHGSAGVPGTSYKTMSDADFMKMANKNLGYS
jgi:hypothetical protein